MRTLANDEILFGLKPEPAPDTDYISIGSRGQVILRRDDQWIKLTPTTPINVTMDTARTIARMQGHYEVEPVDTTGLAMSECPIVDSQQVSIPKYKQDSIGSSSRAPRVDPISRVDPNPDFENWDWPGKG